MDIQTQRGFALPAAVLGLVVVGVLVTGGFFIARQEQRIGSASENGTQAFYVAERGLAETMAKWNMMTYLTDTAWSTHTSADTTDEGIWTVEVTKMTDILYFLDGRGEAPLGASLAGGSVSKQRMATRSIGVIAKVLIADINPPAALTTRGNVEVRGTAEVHGEDTDPDGWGTVCGPFAQQDKTGIMVDTASTVKATGSSNVSGKPKKVEYSPDITDETFTQFGELTWDDLVSRASLVYAGGTFNGMEPSFTGEGECDYSDRSNWGDPLDPTSACGNYFPMVYIDGDMLVQSSSVGQGILLVEGNIDLRGDFLWHGLVIAQGTFHTEGSGNRVLGGVLASNADLYDELLVGGSVVQNSTCALKRAILLNSGLTRARPLASRSWIDLSAVQP